MIVTPDLAGLVETAASRIAARIDETRSRVAICLTGGSTPKPLYERLAGEPYRSRLPWERIHWFWSDERFVPFDDQRNNARLAFSALLDHVPVRPEHIHIIRTALPDSGEAARRYDDTLKRFYGSERLDPERPLFDLVLLGLGSDGHTASLFPDSTALEAPQDCWVVGVDHAKLAPFVPRVTLTLPALASTREMLFLVAGSEKQDVVNRLFSGENFPAARVHTSGQQFWLIDRAAAPAR